MKAPYFKLEQSEEAEIISKIILSDKTPRRFTRSRARHYYDLWVMTDSNTRGVFEMAEKISFCDELFVLYGKDGLPLCVSVTKKRVRILYKGNCFTVTAKKTRHCQNPRKLYLAFLDMLPQSALDMGAFVPERRQYFLAPEKCNYDSVWTVASEVGNEMHFSVNAAKAGVQIWKVHKILFELDKNCNIKTVYSVAGKTYGKFVTRAEATLSGENVVQDLFEKLGGFPQAKDILYKVL